MINIKRPILIAIIGYIIGILWGLYLKFSIVLFYFPIFAIYYFIKILKYKDVKKQKKKFKLISFKRYFRYVKIFFNSKIIFLILIFSIISNFIILFQNKKYDNLYRDINDIKIVGVIVSNNKEKEFVNTYKLKVFDCNNSNRFKNTYLIIKINKKEKTNLQYGDKVLIKGEYIKPDIQRNYKGFNYKEYLKSIKVYGTINVRKIEVLAKKQLNPMLIISNEVSEKIKRNIDSIMDENSANIFKGLILGEKDEIDGNIKERFKIGNISHVLVVSGMHVSYIVLGIDLLFKRILGKRKTKVLIIFVLVCYMFITGFSASIVRAGVMGILVTFSGLIFRKNDIWNSISISLFINLLYNPYLITNAGLQLSYIGTIGIILLYRNIHSYFKNKEAKNRRKRYRIIINKNILVLIDKLKEILATIISAQIVILPILIYNFNVVGSYFFITNILVSLIIGPIIILGFILVIISFFNFTVSSLFSKIVVLGIKLLIFISDITKLPFSKIYLKTPNIVYIIIYYVLVIIFNYLYLVYNSKKSNNTQARVRNLIALAKYKFNKNRDKCYIILVILMSILIVINILPNKLKIYFVDVGQGDCTFIKTPMNKSILIDGGGSLSKEFDVGKSTLLPYLLDRGYTKIDYIFISHFDQDHVGGLFTIMEELRVGEVIIPKQGEDSDNYRRFKEIVRNKRIKVRVVNKGDRFQIEKNLYFDILWPNNSSLISENILNNNSIVCKLNYKDFSCVFTGDIEQIAEKQMINEYKKDLSILDSKILKVGHHGSKTSSTQEFVEAVKPKIALIGVGENNKFGHPNGDVLERLENLRYKNISYRSNGRDNNNSE